MSVPSPPIPAVESSTPWLASDVRHYENFPVASMLLPSRLRPPVVAIYRFARYADDVADEGCASAEQRLSELERLRRALVEPGPSGHPAVDPLFQHIDRHRLDRTLLTDLLSAFEQDVRISRYPSFAALLDYCRRSANPIGRLLLALFDRRDEQSAALSDSICSSLQIINFLQDLGIDWNKGRLYLPCDELTAADITEDRIGQAVANGHCDAGLRALLGEQARRARRMLEAGRPLIAKVPLRLALELRAIVAGGRQILAQLEKSGFDPVARRPVLTAADMPAILAKMLR